MDALNSWPTKLAGHWDPEKDYTQDTDFCTMQARMFFDSRGYPASDATALFACLRNINVKTTHGFQNNPVLWATLINNASEDELRKLLHLANRISQSNEPALTNATAELCQGIYDRSKSLNPMILKGFALVQGVGTLLHELDECPPCFRQLPANSPAAQRQSGVPNVVVCRSSSEVLPTLLSLYAPMSRLPLAYEIEFCGLQTSWERVELLLKRCVDRGADEAHEHLFCLADCDSLARAQQLDLVNALESLQLSRLSFRLVLLCTKRDNIYSESFHKYVVDCPPLQVATQQDYWKLATPPSWEADQSSLHIKVYTSQKVGLGKSYQVRKDIKDAVPRVLGDVQLPHARVFVPVFQDTDTDQIFNYLQEGTTVGDSPARAFHINVASSADRPIDILLFRLLILNDLETSAGKHFCLQSKHAVLIELASDSGKGTQEKLPLVERLTFVLACRTMKLCWAQEFSTLPSQRFKWCANTCMLCRTTSSRRCGASTLCSRLVIRLLRAVSRRQRSAGSYSRSTCPRPQSTRSKQYWTNR